MRIQKVDRLEIVLLTLQCHKENILGSVASLGRVAGRKSQPIKFMTRRASRSDIEKPRPSLGKSNNAPSVLSHGSLGSPLKSTGKVLC